MMVGGTGDLHEATAEVQALVDAVRGAYESKEGKAPSQFTAISYKSQVVAGTNFFVKVQVEDAEFAHLRIFRPLGADPTPELAASQTGKSADDPLEYFG